MSAFPYSSAFAAAAPLFSVRAEAEADVAPREALLDAVVGPGRTRKSSEAIRAGRLPAKGLAFAAEAADGALVGTVRLWDVLVGGPAGPVAALLLGPLCVDGALHGAGIGGALMRHAVAEAARLGHGAILLVGDPEYYQRFGFSAGATADLAMPGPFEPRRLLATELRAGSLGGVFGLIRPSGRRASGRGEPACGIDAAELSPSGARAAAAA